jgi:hypothetical protein
LDRKKQKRNIRGKSGRRGSAWQRYTSGTDDKFELRYKDTGKGKVDLVLN